MWLENRRILSNAINNSENGLGETSRSAFSDMKDMYEGRNGILSKAKIDTKGAPSGLKTFMDSGVGKATKAAVKGAGMASGLHLLP